MSLHANSQEWVLHIEKQADLRICMQTLETRKTVIDTIKMFYAGKTYRNLPIFGVRQKNLAIYTTQESDV